MRSKCCVQLENWFICLDVVGSSKEPQIHPTENIHGGFISIPGITHSPHTKFMYHLHVKPYRDRKFNNGY